MGRGERRGGDTVGGPSVGKGGTRTGRQRVPAEGQRRERRWNLGNWGKAGGEMMKGGTTFEVGGDTGKRVGLEAKGRIL